MPSFSSTDEAPTIVRCLLTLPFTLSKLLQTHDGIHLDQCAARQARDADRRARWIRLGKKSRPDPVDAREVCKVGQISRPLHDIAEAAPCRNRDSPQIFKHAH